MNRLISVGLITACNNYPKVSSPRGGARPQDDRVGIRLRIGGQDRRARRFTAPAIFQKLAGDHPAVSGFRVRLATSHLNLGDLLSNTDRRREAEAEYHTGLEIYRRLADAEPGNPHWRRDIGKSVANLGNLDIEAGRLGPAADRLRESVMLHERLAADYPAITDYRNGLAFALTALGRALHRAGRGAEAEAPLQLRPAAHGPGHAGRPVRPRCRARSVSW